jgi:hypothetical protein
MPKRTVNDKLRFTEKQIAEGLKQASRHHIESFDYALKTCLPRICRNLLVTDISADAPEAQAYKGAFPFKKMTIWFESLELRKPVRTDAGSSLMNLTQAAKG